MTDDAYRLELLRAGANQLAYMAMAPGFCPVPLVPAMIQSFRMMVQGILGVSGAWGPRSNSEIVEVGDPRTEGYINS